MLSGRARCSGSRPGLTGLGAARIKTGAKRLPIILISIAAAMTLPLIAASPANADIVRQRQQWVLDTLNVPAAWQLTHGRGVTVAVIDSGVDPGVSDLAGSVITGPDLTGVHTPPSRTGGRTGPGWRP